MTDLQIITKIAMDPKLDSSIKSLVSAIINEEDHKFLDFSTSVEQFGAAIIIFLENNETAHITLIDNHSNMTRDVYNTKDIIIYLASKKLFKITSIVWGDGELSFNLKSIKEQ